MEWKVYILWSDRKRWYTGCAQDEIKRLQQHNSGRVTSTRSYRPWEIIHVEVAGGYGSARREGEIL